MKNLFIKYYAIIMMSLFLINNLLFYNIKIGGLLYQIFMIIIIIFNGFILLKFRGNIRFKILVIIILFFTWIFSNNLLQLLFVLFNILFLCILGFMESHIIKVLSILMTIFFVVLFYHLLFIFLFFYGDGLDSNYGMNDVYSDMHYYCDNNYEVYAYSAGAMDRFHYSIGKHYDFIDVNGIIYVIYRERREVSHEKYENFLKNNKCSLVGDIDGD